MMCKNCIIWQETFPESKTGKKKYLQTVVVLVGVFEKTVHWIQNFVWKKEEPFPKKEILQIRKEIDSSTMIKYKQW